MLSGLKGWVPVQQPAQAQAQAYFWAVEGRWLVVTRAQQHVPKAYTPYTHFYLKVRISQVFTDVIHKVIPESYIIKA